MLPTGSLMKMLADLKKVVSAVSSGRTGTLPRLRPPRLLDAFSPLPLPDWWPSWRALLLRARELDRFEECGRAEDVEVDARGGCTDMLLACPPCFTCHSREG